MIPTLETIIKVSGIHPSRVFNVYIFGSRVYSTFNDKSDWDIIMVANNSVNSTEQRKGLFNIHIYTPNKFQEDLDWHRINNLECIYAPDWAILKEDRKFTFRFDIKKLRHAISHISSNSWVKANKKIQFDEYYTGVKSLYHSLRIPIFATQIVKDGRITDFTSANWIWDKIKSKQWTWEELDSEFREPRNRILTEFKKVTYK